MEDGLLIVAAILAMIPVTLLLKKFLDGMDSKPTQKDDSKDEN